MTTGDIVQSPTPAVSSADVATISSPAFASAPTVGNTDVICCVGPNTFGTPSGYTDAVHSVHNDGLYVFYKTVASGDTGAAVTITDSSGTDALAVFRYEIEGTPTVDVTQDRNYQSTSTTARTTNSITLAKPGYVLMFATDHQTATVTWSGFSNGITQQQTAVPSGGTRPRNGMVAYGKNIAAGTYSFTATAGTASTIYQIATVSFAFNVTSATAGLASATAAANSATTQTSGANAGVAAASGAAFPAYTLTAGTAATTGAAETPVANIEPSAGLAGAAGAAYDATISHWGAPSGSGIALASTADVGPVPGAAATTGVAEGPAASLGPTGGVATTTGAAYNPSVSTATPSPSNAHAQLAVAIGAVRDVGTSVQPVAALTSAAGTVPTVSADPGAAPGVASGTAQAFLPATAVVSPAGAALAVGVAHDGAPGSPSVIFIFSPPVQYEIPPVLPEPHPGNRLMRHYASRPAGRAIWVLTDGTYTFYQPFPTIEDTPANRQETWPNPPTPNWSNQGVTYTKVYLGGHTYTITDAAEHTALANFLTAEGYTPSDWLVPA